MFMRRSRTCPTSLQEQEQNSGQAGELLSGSLGDSLGSLTGLQPMSKMTRRSRSNALSRQCHATDTSDCSSEIEHSTSAPATSDSDPSSARGTHAWMIDLPEASTEPAQPAKTMSGSLEQLSGSLEHLKTGVDMMAMSGEWQEWFANNREVLEQRISGLDNSKDCSSNDPANASMKSLDLDAPGSTTNRLDATADSEVFEEFFKRMSICDLEDILNSSLNSSAGKGQGGAPMAQEQTSAPVDLTASAEALLGLTLDPAPGPAEPVDVPAECPELTASAEALFAPVLGSPVPAPPLAQPPTVPQQIDRPTCAVTTAPVMHIAAPYSDHQMAQLIQEELEQGSGFLGKRHLFLVPPIVSPQAAAEVRVLYRCTYCGKTKSSTSHGGDGRVRIRCKCGGKYADNKDRLHANWKLVDPA